MRLFALPLLVLWALPLWAHAAQVCDLDGQPVSPSNGNTTAGKSGLMRCRDGEGGPLVREQELKNGAFIGLVRSYRDGLLLREYSINERGNKEGRSREFSRSQLVSEENYSNGKRTGLARHWRANGRLRRVSFHADDGQEQAVAEFTQQGRLGELRCAAKPLLGPDADDATWCGHRGSPASVPLYAEDGRPRGTLVHERGELRQSETLWASGKPREQQVITGDHGVERSFSDAGVKRREREWVEAGPASKARRTITLDREYHDSGVLLRERHWKPTERGGEMQLEQRWYLNGQPRDKQEYLIIDGQAARRETLFHDNGRISYQGVWLASGRRGGNQASGVHNRYDSEGRLRLEKHHDAKGRVTREREFDESGQVKRDDELHEDGSRKNPSPR